MVFQYTFFGRNSKKRLQENSDSKFSVLEYLNSIHGHRSSSSSSENDCSHEQYNNFENGMNSVSEDEDLGTDSSEWEEEEYEDDDED